MGLFDKIKDLADEHADKVEGAIDKVADVVDENTGGKYSEHIGTGVEKAKQLVGDSGADAAIETEPPAASSRSSRLGLRNPRRVASPAKEPSDITGAALLARGTIGIRTSLLWRSGGTRLSVDMAPCGPTAQPLPSVPSA